MVCANLINCFSGRIIVFMVLDKQVLECKLKISNLLNGNRLGYYDNNRYFLDLKHKFVDSSHVSSKNKHHKLLMAFSL
jgi:hypothetical protein